MNYILVTPEVVEALHDSVLNSGELAGRALDKSLEGALARVANRLAYGMIEDVFDLAAAYPVPIATGHVFNDANKRTSFDVMNFCLITNGIQIDWNTTEVADLIIRTAQGLVPEEDLAAWLRAKAY